MDMEDKKRFWEYKVCRGYPEPNELLYPGRRVCHSCGGSVCVGSLEYQNPDPEATRRRIPEDGLSGREHAFAIRRFVNRRTGGGGSP